MRTEIPRATYPGRADRGEDAVEHAGRASGSSASEVGMSCANCKMPIEHEPVEKAGRPFCCDGCADGGPCLC